MTAFWLLILGLALSSFIPRASFITLFARWPVPAQVQRGLRYVPAAVFSAILVPERTPSFEETIWTWCASLISLTIRPTRMTEFS